MSDPATAAVDLALEGPAAPTLLVPEAAAPTAVVEASAATTETVLTPEPSGGIALPVVLRGTRRGLEVAVAADATAEGIADALAARLGEAPKFFAGSRARVSFAGPIPAGALRRLEEVAARFELMLVEIGPAVPPAPRAASGTGPIPAPEASVLEGAATEPAIDLAATIDAPPPAPAEAIDSAAYAAFDVAAAPGPRVLVGPVRSGVILEHPGHLVVVGDVNPGAEVRAEGNVIVLGRLRGVAHAGVGRDAGFIFALSLQPQQLRIGKLVARAAADEAGDGAEIAYATGKTIVVERYQGRLPSGLSASM
jgi:septum formation inhibitor MinC